MAFPRIIQGNTPILQAGKFRHRISIVNTLQTQDSTGGFNLQTTVLFAAVWASVEAISGSEKLAAQSFTSQVTHKIIIRYIGAAPSWIPSFNYLGSTLIKDSNGNLQQSLGGGLSGVDKPTWNQNVGQQTQDGDPSTGVTWVNLRKAPTRAGVTANMQVIFNGRLFQIEDVLNVDERSKFLILNCIETNDSLQLSPTVNS